MNGRRRALLALTLAVGLTLGACGDDDSTESAGGDDSSDARTSIYVSLSMDGVEVPDELEGGIVNVIMDTELEAGEVNFTRVAPGTTEEAFRQGIADYYGGGPLPEFVQATSGIAGDKGATEATLTLSEGEYIVWSVPEPPEGEEDGEGGEESAEAPEESAAGGEEGGEEGGGGPPPEAVLTRSVAVTGGEAGDLPEADGRITARDYTFDVEVTGSTEQVVFFNDGPDQYHHAILIDFENLDPKVVEENLPALFESEEGTPPPDVFKDIDLEGPEAGFTGVFSPGLGGISPMKIEEGKTYVLACFLPDKTGGPPHAIAKGMRTVFKAGA